VCWHHSLHHVGMGQEQEWPQFRPMFIDPDATSADPELPAFLARPPGAPVYHGFPLVEGAEVDGFQLGMISGMGGCVGDGYVVAPDGSRAGLIWEAEVEEAYFREQLAPEPGRWGVFAVGLPLPLRNPEQARAYLAGLLPELRPRWQAWRRQQGRGQRPALEG
jgi:hypothetical protein